MEGVEEKITFEIKQKTMDDRELKSNLSSILGELLNFLKQSLTPGSFRCSVVQDVIKLGSKGKQPTVTAHELCLIAKCLPFVFQFLSEGLSHSLEELLLSAEAAAALLAFCPPEDTASFIDHCYQQLKDQPCSVLYYVEENCCFQLKLTVAQPLNFKLCLARGLLRNQHCCTPSMMMYVTKPIAESCFQYSPLTCLGFRTLHMWLLQCKMLNICIGNDVFQKVYTIIVDNWENQTPGVRKEIFKIIEDLLNLACPASEYTVEKLMAHVINDLSVKMKSKYFLLSILIPKYGVSKALNEFPSIVPILVNSLRSIRLMSAGTDAYRMCLSSLLDMDDWCHFFLKPILSLLTSQKAEDRLAQLNLLSRWLNPTLRRFPPLVKVLLQDLTIKENTNKMNDLALNALLHISRKEGYVDVIWPEYSFVNYGLVHSDEEVRKHAFGAVCKKTKKSLVPAAEEFEAVKHFLVENVNADSCTLRQSLVESFSSFLERLHASSMKLAFSKGEDKCTWPLLSFTFLNWLHHFLLENLNLRGNYQRIITSLLLFQEVMAWFGPRDLKQCIDTARMRSLAKNLDMWYFESNDTWEAVVNCILSPSEDIQKVAGDILANHLQLLDDENLFIRMERLWVLTKRQSQSSLFYEARSGVVLMRLITQFLHQRPELLSVIASSSAGLEDRLESHALQPIKPFQSGEGVKMLVSIWMEEVLSHWCSCKADVLTAVTSGAALHGILSAFQPIVPHMTSGDILCLNNTLQMITNWLLDLLSGQTGSSMSASFAEMTQAIDGLLPEEEVELFGSQVSPAHQLVLSCIWLSLKESCALATILLCQPHTSVTQAMSCLTLVTNVLLRCRHKGTIEAAGIALSTMVHYITEIHETKNSAAQLDSKNKQKLHDYLCIILLDVMVGIPEHCKQTSITRKSAGVGILVQKIVASDSRPDKPLLTLCLQTLCEIVESAPLSECTVEECDLPQASALHLLCRLAQDASLRLAMLPYASAVALLCFQAFLSPAWTVQNAALQLFGVLVPLLVGEKKVHDDDTETFGNNTTEEFISHHPSIVAFFIKELQMATNDLNRSKHIIPVLSLLSKLTYGDNWSIDNDSSEMKYFQKYLGLLLRDTDFTVRTIAAKCYSRFMHKTFVLKSVYELLDRFKEHQAMPQNEIHGCMETLHLLMYRLIDDNASKVVFQNIHQLFQIGNFSKASWITKKLAIDISKLLLFQCGDTIAISRFESMGDILQEHDDPIGFDFWLINYIEFISNVCNEGDLCAIFTCLMSSNRESLVNPCIFEIQNRISSLSEPTKEHLAYALMSSISHDRTENLNLPAPIYTALLELMPYVKVTPKLEVASLIYQSAKRLNDVQSWSVAFPLCCEIFVSNFEQLNNLQEIHKVLLKTLVTEMEKLTSAEKYDVEERVHGAKAFVALFKVLTFLHSKNENPDSVWYINIAHVVVDCGVLFLQDEDVTVRKEASKFIFPEKNPYFCLLTLLSVDGLRSLFSDFHVARYFYLCLQKLDTWETLIVRCKHHRNSIVGCSPFDSGTSNIYAEEAHIMQTMANSLLSLLQEQPPWTTELKPLLILKKAEMMIAKLLQEWKLSQKGAVGSTSYFSVVKLRLKLLSQVNKIIFKTCESQKLFENLADLVSSTVGD